MLSFAQALNKLGTEVTVGTDRSFQPEVEKLGLNFQEVQINKNAKHGCCPGIPEKQRRTSSPGRIPGGHKERGCGNINDTKQA
jgi:hypothetical protein